MSSAVPSGPPVAFAKVQPLARLFQVVLALLLAVSAVLLAG